MPGQPRAGLAPWAAQAICSAWDSHKFRVAHAGLFLRREGESGPYLPAQDFENLLQKIPNPYRAHKFSKLLFFQYFLALHSHFSVGNNYTYFPQ